MKTSELLSAPVTVNWSLSYACNFTCRHCYSRQEKGAGLSLEELMAAASILAERGVVFVNFGGGEPLLFPHLFELAHFAREKGLNVSMNTNGWLLDRDAARRLQDAGFTQVGVSVDSPRAGVHDRFRDRAGSHKRALAALDHLGAVSLPATVSCVVFRDNLPDWEGMIPLCRDHGVGVLYLHNYKCTGNGLINMRELDLSPEQWKAFYAKALKVKAATPDVSLSFDDPIMASLPGYRASGAVPGSTCGKLSLHLRPNGDITPCGFIPLVVGNVLKDDFDKVWYDSGVLNRMRNKTAQGKCRGCGSYEACLGGCTARVFALTGEFDQPDPHCWEGDQ